MDIRRIQSDVRFKINGLLNTNDIVIASQRDVHLDTFVPEIKMTQSTYKKNAPDEVAHNYNNSTITTRDYFV